MSMRIVLILSIGLMAPLALAGELTVDGEIETTLGGLKFPDGSVQDRAKMSYANVLNVAQAGGDFTTIQMAIDSITDAAVDNQYLVLVAPGTYVEQVTMKVFVDVEGAGEDITTISSSGATISLTCASNTVLRDLTVEHTGGAVTATAISCTSSVSMHLTRVAVRASGDSNNIAVKLDGGSAVLAQVNLEATCTGNTGSCRGINVIGGSANLLLINSRILVNGTGTSNAGLSASASPGNHTFALIDVSISATGAASTRNDGVQFIAGGQLSLLRVDVTSSGAALFNEGVIHNGTAEIRDSRIEASGIAASAVHTTLTAVQASIERSVLVGSLVAVRVVGGTARIGGNFLDGGSVLGAGATATCVNNVDQTFTFFADTCP